MLKRAGNPARRAVSCRKEPIIPLAVPFRALSAKMSDFALNSRDFTAKHCKNGVFRCFCTANYCKSALIKRFSANHAFIIGLTLRKSHNPAQSAAPCTAKPARALAAPLRAAQSPQVRLQCRFVRCPRKCPILRENRVISLQNTAKMGFFAVFALQNTANRR